MSDDRKQCAGCGAVFYVPDRELCIECTLSERDRLRVQAGPTKRGPGNLNGVVLNVEMVLLGGIRRELYFGERLEQGFRMLHGEPATYD